MNRLCPRLVWFGFGLVSHTIKQYSPPQRKGLVIIIFKEPAYPETAVGFSLSLLCVSSSPFPPVLSPSSFQPPLIHSLSCFSPCDSGRTPGWMLSLWAELEKMTWEIDWPGLPQRCR